jgi:hypothetical protein
LAQEGQVVTVVVAELFKDGGGGVDAAGGEVVDGLDLHVALAGELLATEADSQGGDDGCCLVLEGDGLSHQTGLFVGFGLFPDCDGDFGVGSQRARAFDFSSDSRIQTWW